MPDDSGHSSHDGHACDARTFLAFDFVEPGLHHRVVSEHMTTGLAEHPPRHSAAGLGDTSDANSVKESDATKVSGKSFRRPSQV